MPTRDPQDNRKQPVKVPPRSTEPQDEHETRERSGLDPLADENPAICRGID